MQLNLKHGNPPLLIPGDIHDGAGIDLDEIADLMDGMRDI